MSYMFEVYYQPPPDMEREEGITGRVIDQGGRLDYREVPHSGETGSICLTYEFDELDTARRAAVLLREQGEHVEGPVDYGP